MIKRLIAQLGLATAIGLMSMSASAAVINQIFTFSAADIVNLWSTSLEPVPCAASAPGDFFGCVPDSPAANVITINNLGGFAGGGSLNVQWDDATGEITQVNNMKVLLRDIDVIIAGTAGPTTVSVRRGTPGPAASPDDLPTIQAGVGAANGTADADQDTLFNTGASITKFQHNDGPNTDVPDFSTFADIVDSCTGPLCALIGILTLDAVQYELLGTVNSNGGDALTLTAETANGSSYIVNLQTAVVPVPAAVWLFGSALGLLGWIRRRQLV